MIQQATPGAQNFQKVGLCIFLLISKQINNLYIYTNGHQSDYGKWE